MVPIAIGDCIHKAEIELRLTGLMTQRNKQLFTLLFPLSFLFRRAALLKRRLQVRQRAKLYEQEGWLVFISPDRMIWEACCEAHFHQCLEAASGAAKWGECEIVTSNLIEIMKESRQNTTHPRALDLKSLEAVERLRKSVHVHCREDCRSAWKSPSGGAAAN